MRVSNVNRPTHVQLTLKCKAIIITTTPPANSAWEMSSAVSVYQ